MSARRERGTLRFDFTAAEPVRERLVAELHELGTLGLEERADRLLAYFAPDTAAAPVLALEQLGVKVEGPLALEDADWEVRWREGLAPRRVGRLWIRPSWCESRGVPELVIDPRRAFGTGEHATTRLALAALLEALEPGDRVLDVGTGTGILALGALACGARAALGLDVDPDACRNARDNARENALPLPLVCGTPSALDARARFDLVVANEILVRLEPWLPELAARARRTLIVSGLLAGQRDTLLRTLAHSAVELRDERSEEQGGECWLACVFAPRRLPGGAR